MTTVDLYQTPLRYGPAYDELSADGVTPRPHWTHLMESLRAIGPDELGRRWGRAERRIRENGITYNIYSDPLGANRPWQIDILPLLIPAEEWRVIQAGIVQRAQLLSRLLEDLYGPQELIANERFPAALLYANPAFLRPLVGVSVPAHSYLHMLAVDLARSPDGQWWVLADRTQAPSGSGYALENRTNRRRRSARSLPAPQTCCDSLLFSRTTRSANHPVSVQPSPHRAAHARPAQRNIL